MVKSQFSPISPNPQAASRPSSSVVSICCGWPASCTLSWGGRYEGSKENSSGIDRCWQLGLVRTCPGAEAFTGVRDRSYLQPTQGSGDGGRYRVWHSSRSREFGCVCDGPIGRPGPGADHLSST